MSIEQVLCEINKKYKEILDQFNDLNKRLENGMIQSVEDKEFLDINGVAELTGLAKQTIYDLKHKEQLPFFHMGRLLRFRKAEIIDWMLTRNQLNN